MASTISLDMAQSPDEVGACDGAVGDRDDALGGGDRDLALGGADELAGQVAVGRHARSRRAVRTRARRPTKRRKCWGLVSGRSGPGEETSSAKRSR